MISTVVVVVIVGGVAVLPINMYVQSGQPDRRRKAVKGKRGCRFGCFHIEMIRDQDDKPKSALPERLASSVESWLFQYDTEELMEVEEFKNESSCFPGPTGSSI